MQVNMLKRLVSVFTIMIFSMTTIVLANSRSMALFGLVIALSLVFSLLNLIRMSLVTVLKNSFLFFRIENTLF